MYPLQYAVSIDTLRTSQSLRYILRVLLNAVDIGICIIVFSSLSADSGGGSGKLLAFLLQRPVDEEVEHDERHEGDQVDEHRHEGRDLQ